MLLSIYEIITISLLRKNNKKQIYKITIIIYILFFSLKTEYCICT